MKWQEFKMLLVGIAPDTPLGRIVTIRAENDKEILKQFSKEQKKIRTNWRNKSTKKMNLNDYNNAMKLFENAFKAMGCEQ